MDAKKYKGSAIAGELTGDETYAIPGLFFGVRHVMPKRKQKLPKPISMNSIRAQLAAKLCWLGGISHQRRNIINLLLPLPLWVVPCLRS